MQTKNETPATVLVALMPEVKDWATLLKELWYRIPIDNVPPILQNGQAKYIAFYHTAKFKEDLKWQIVYYAEIKRIVIATRRELFPTESPYHGKANRRYYKVEFDALIPLPKPIVSRRGHRILFVPTTEEQFFSKSTNFNKVFKNSYLEAKMIDIMADSRKRRKTHQTNDVQNHQRFRRLSRCPRTRNGISIESQTESQRNRTNKVVFKRLKDGLEAPLSKTANP